MTIIVGNIWHLVDQIRSKIGYDAGGSVENNTTNPGIHVQEVKLMNEIDEGKVRYKNRRNQIVGGAALILFGLVALVAQFVKQSYMIALGLRLN